MSRPSKLTPRSRDRFLQAIAAGAFPEIAARHAGFSAASYYRYLKGSTPEHAEFRQAALDARATFELRLSATLTKAALEDPKWALILLERHFPERWLGRSAPIAPREAPPEQPAHEAPDILILDPGLIDSIVPKLLEAGRRLHEQTETDTDHVDRFQHRTAARARRSADQ